MSYLATQYPGVDIVGGRRPKDSATAVNRRDKDLICVFSKPWNELPRDPSITTPGLAIRWFPTRSKQPQDTTPDDPTTLEQAEWNLISAFTRATQVPGFFADRVAWRLTGITQNDRDDQWYVEASLTAFMLREAA